MINWKIQLKGTWTLLKKELLRFWRVVFQTVAAPVITGILYLLIFSHVLDSRTEVYTGVPYSAFLIPGLIMMSLLQNAFANSSSSLVQSKVMGNIVFILLTPLTYIQFFIAFLIASIVRGLFVGLAIYVLASFYIDLPIMYPGFVFSFALLGGGLLGTFGILAGIWADRFDQMAAFQNFVIMPLSFLSGTFYSIDRLSGIWYNISQLNPFFYLIDGFRYGFTGHAEADISIGIIYSLSINIILWVICYKMFKSGYKLRA